MTLIDRIARDETLSSDQRIGGHLFDSIVWIWLRGYATKQNVIDTFGLDGTDSTKLDEFKTKFDSLTAQNKIAYFTDFTASLILLQNKIITKAQFKTIVGLS